MPKFRVSVSGTLDWEYDVEAEDEEEAESEAEERFYHEFSKIMWSGVSSWDAEEIPE